MRPSSLALGLLLLGLLTPACALERGGLAVDGALRDASSDAGLDAGPDAGSDASLDAGLDAGSVDSGPRCEPSLCPGLRCTDGACDHYLSCAALHAASPTLPSGAYEIRPSPSLDPFRVYCEMESDGGGWVLLLKVDGDSDIFEYNQAIWTDSSLLSADSLDMSETEAKLEGFSSIPLTEMRVGMHRIGAAPGIAWLRFPLTASSLHELFNRSGETPLSVPRGDWLALIEGSELQPNCNRGGVNLISGGYARVRVGFLGNEQNDCNSSDSYIGVGACYRDYCPDSASVAGNYTRWNSSNGGDRTLPAFAWVMVR